MRLLGRFLVVLLFAYAALLGGVLYAMHQPPGTFGQVMARMPRALMPAMPFKPMWNFARAGSLRVGDEAPDFTLATQDASRSVRLASFRGKRPVVLVFGSYT